MISDEELATISTEGTQWHSITMQIAAELLERREEARKTCKWNINRAGSALTGCGHGWGFAEDYAITFCPYCGHHIEEVQP